MHVLPIFDFDELVPHADAWDRLAREIPFRGWTWNETWWRHYGPKRPGRRRRLFVLLVLDVSDHVVAVAPWCIDRSRLGHRVVRFLGAGELHPDYLGVPCEPGLEDDVAAALAEWLIAQRDQTARGDGTRWDRLELDCLDATDRVVARMAQWLHAAGDTVHRCQGPACWRIDLPADVGQYVASLSKTARKRFRRIQRRLLDSGRAVLRQITTKGQLSEAFEVLIDLHQRRRETFGQPGCFVSPRFTAFHRDVAERLLVRGQMLMHVLDVDGRPAAVEYGFAGGGVIYAYQSGMDPARLDLEPGHAATVAMLRWAINNGYRAYDLLRGDEPYKAHWRPQRRETAELRVVAPRPAAQLCHAAWLAGSEVKRWAKWGLGIGE